MDSGNDQLAMLRNDLKHIDNSAFNSHPYCLSIFLTKEWSNDKISVTMSKLSVYFPHTIRCFHLHHSVLCSNNVNKNAPLTYFYGF